MAQLSSDIVDQASSKFQSTGKRDRRNRSLPAFRQFHIHAYIQLVIITSDIPQWRSTKSQRLFGRLQKNFFQIDEFDVIVGAVIGRFLPYRSIHAFAEIAVPIDEPSTREDERPAALVAASPARGVHERFRHADTRLYPFSGRDLMTRGARPMSFERVSVSDRDGA